MKFVRSLLAISLFCACGTVAQAEYSVEVLKEPAPADAVSAEIAAALSKTGLRISEDGEAVYDIWLRDTWPVKDGFKPTLQILYPFQMGDLLGVIRLAKRTEDFRQQQLRSGVYTMRYFQQPVDGNHVGTSDTLDFFLLSKASEDEKLAPPDKADLFANSANAARSSHPAMLSMVPSSSKEAPAMRFQDDTEWWVLSVSNKTKAGDKEGKLTIDFVVAGHALE